MSDSVTVDNVARVLEVRVLTAAVPRIAPAVLAEHLSPEVGEDGRLVDWNLRMGADLDEPHMNEVLIAFAAFRNGYSRRAIVGDRRRLRMMTAWAASHGCGVDALRAMDYHNVVLDPATSLRASKQLREVGGLMRRLAPPAVGWFRVGATGLAGGALGDELASPTGVVVSQHGSATVHALTDRLEVRVGRHLAVAGREAAPTVVTAWALEPSGAVTVDGVDVEPDVGRALSLLAPGASAARVASVPATSVTAGLLTTLAEVCEQAARSARSVHLAG